MGSCKAMGRRPFAWVSRRQLFSSIPTAQAKMALTQHLAPPPEQHQPSPANGSPGPGPAGSPAPGETVADACIKLSQPPPALSLHIEQRKNSTHLR